ncbi:hypothetical protein FRAHR75_1520009 [Frankia sp. Hr75.2]|nr:hypothetical protein FRAHR75_1520009 [Frankia sp. Hr75.2]
MVKRRDIELPHPYDGLLNEAVKSLDEADALRIEAKRHLRICMAALVIAGVKPRDVGLRVGQKRSDVDHALEVVESRAGEKKEADRLARSLTMEAKPRSPAHERTVASQ